MLIPVGLCQLPMALGKSRNGVFVSAPVTSVKVRLRRLCGQATRHFCSSLLRASLWVIMLLGPRFPHRNCVQLRFVVAGGAALRALSTAVGHKCQDGSESRAQFPPPSVLKRSACNYCNIHVHADVRLCGSCFRARKCASHRYGERSPICSLCSRVRTLLYVSLCVALVSWEVFSPCKGYKGEGPVAIASASVTSCLKHSTRIANLDIENLHCICMQESRIPESKLRQLSRKFDGYGWELILGPQPPVKKLHGKSSGFRQTTGGLAALVRKGYGYAAVDIEGSFASIRTCCQVLFLPFQQTGCYIINVYLPSGGQAMRSRGELMESIFCYAASLGSAPVMICGDFQSKPEDNSAILHAFITDEWFDVHAERQKLLGKQPEHTFARSNSSDAGDKGKSRIDFFLFNKHLLPFFSSSGVLPKSGLPNHSPCFVELSIAKVTSTVHVAKPHPKWKFNDPIPQTKQQWVDRDSLVQPILQSAIPSLIQAAKSCDAEALWTIACETVTECLNKISGQSLPATRGKLPSFKAVPLARPNYQTKLANSVKPLLKKLHELRKKSKPLDSFVFPTVAL